MKSSYAAWHRNSPAGELEAEVLPLTWERCADHLREYAGRYAEEKHGEQDDVYRAAVKLANHTIVTLNVRDPIRLQGLFDSDPTLWGEQADIGIRPLTALAGNIPSGRLDGGGGNGPIDPHRIAGDHRRTTQRSRSRRCRVKPRALGGGPLPPC